jgi:hypothetical protein
VSDAYPVAGLAVCVWGGSATAARLDLGAVRNVMIPSSVFFPWPAATLDVI